MDKFYNKTLHKLETATNKSEIENLITRNYIIRKRNQSLPSCQRQKDSKCTNDRRVGDGIGQDRKRRTRYNTVHNRYQSLHNRDHPRTLVIDHSPGKYLPTQMPKMLRAKPSYQRKNHKMS